MISRLDSTNESGDTVAFVGVGSADVADNQQTNGSLSALDQKPIEQRIQELRKKVEDGKSKQPEADIALLEISNVMNDGEISESAKAEYTINKINEFIATNGYGKTKTFFDSFNSFYSGTSLDSTKLEKLVFNGSEKKINFKSYTLNSGIKDNLVTLTNKVSSERNKLLKEIAKITGKEISKEINPSLNLKVFVNDLNSDASINTREELKMIKTYLDNPSSKNDPDYKETLKKYNKDLVIRNLLDKYSSLENTLKQTVIQDLKQKYKETSQSMEYDSQIEAIYQRISELGDTSKAIDSSLVGDVLGQMFYDLNPSYATLNKERTYSIYKDRESGRILFANEIKNDISKYNFTYTNLEGTLEHDPSHVSTSLLTGVMHSIRTPLDPGPDTITKSDGTNVPNSYGTLEPSNPDATYQVVAYKGENDSIQETFVWPVANPIITGVSHTGVTGVPVGVKFDHKASDGGHLGYDIQFSTPKNLDMVAPVKGEVVKINYGTRLGNSIEVRDEKGRIWTLGHMEGFSNQIRVGARIEAGTYLGRMGNSGTIPVHLHLEVERQFTDPNGIEIVEKLDVGKLLGFGNYKAQVEVPVPFVERPY